MIKWNIKSKIADLEYLSSLLLSNVWKIAKGNIWFIFRIRYNGAENKSVDCGIPRKQNIQNEFHEFSMDSNGKLMF